MADDSTAADSSRDEKQNAPQKIFLVPYPKIVFLYPTFLAAIIAGLVIMIRGDQQDDQLSNFISLGFLVLLAINLVVISFDFPRTTSLTLFFFVIAVAVGLTFLFYSNPGLLGPVGDFFKKLKPFANEWFYFLFALLMLFIYIGVFISVRFNYWEVRPNELLHHHGVLSDLKRYSAPNLRIDKEISDIFEYVLLRSGRLILHPSNERRAIVLENVFFINKKEEQITQMLGALQVRVRTDD